ncbi:thiamine phosphate synthase [Sphingomonas jatrophae]|uniref:Thiamine-phosphate diphosphorylase n=1 Tax=Sphingomonas jatrophae TaxID=1166337 RepID=A0A1I6LNC4_9SPHN|nr:thiamine phosphate synthase [Sphingomonas jatrophae]SFS04941.1 thiamine-phosphate diphosphorylase [Sphingomonas jatrophae]
MHPRHPPRLWLMTDERMGEALWSALLRLPKGAGVVFRHRSTPGRRALYERVRRIARARRLVLVLAGDVRVAAAWRADGVHGRDPRRTARPLLRTMPVHDPVEAHRAKRADVAFVSPVFATRSHVGAGSLGISGFARLARQVRRPVALGGIDSRRARLLPFAYGWAAIDAWMAPR